MRLFNSTYKLQKYIIREVIFMYDEKFNIQTKRFTIFKNDYVFYIVRKEKLIKEFPKEQVLN